MTAHNENRYFNVQNEHGEDYLCPLDKVKNRTTVSEEEFRECVEKDVVGSYSGNIDIEHL